MNTPPTRRALGRLSALLLGLAFAAGGFAQPAYPDKPVRLIVPFPPSGSTDIVARTVAERLGAALGQNVIVDNKPGATGAIGLGELARAQPDGYTIGLATIGSIAINPAVNRKLPWDPQRDFAPVGYIGSTPFALIVNNALPVNSLEAFIALARQKPGQLTYATGGSGGSQHVAAVLLEDMAGISMRQIPYKGSGPALMDLIGGQVDAMIEPAVSAAPHIRGGKVKALALTGGKRSDSFPGLASANETVKGYEVAAWFALFAPAGTPPALVTRLNRDLGQILRNPQVIERLGQAGVEVAPDSPQQLGSYLAAELGKWRRVVSKAGITAD